MEVLETHAKSKKCNSVEAGLYKFKAQKLDSGILTVDVFSLRNCQRSHPPCLLALILKWRKESNSKKQKGYWRINTLNLCEALPLSHLVRCCGCSWEERNSTHCPQDSCLCSEEENPKTHPRRWGWGAVNSDKSSIIAPWWSTFEAQNPSEENCGNIPFLFWLKKVSYRKRRK